MKPTKNTIILSTIIALTVIITAAFMALRVSSAVHAYPDTGGDYVVVLHGLGRTAVAMEPMAHYLSSKGYTVVNVSYPSTRLGVDRLACNVVAPLVEQHCPDTTRTVHFVTHSMGGIVVRRMLREASMRHRAGRVVMLGPPNTGSELADAFGDDLWARLLMGPALQELRVDPASLVNHLGPAQADIGVVAGRCGGGWPGSLVLPGEDDGFVPVARTAVAGMKDREVVDVTHTWLMNDRHVQELTTQFLRHGRFRSI